jgi:gluconate kinase
VETLTVEQLIQHIQRLPDAEKFQLAEQLLPILLRRELRSNELRGTEEVFFYLEKLSDSELDAIVEQVRERNKHFKEEEVTDAIFEALQEVRASSRA